MKYFILESEKGNSIPRIENWYGKIDVRNINRQDYHKLPAHVLLDMVLGIDRVYPDVITSPFLLVSRETIDVIRMYDSSIPFCFTALFDIDKNESAVYYCPILEEDNCLYWGSGKEKGNVILDGNNMKELVLFQTVLGPKKYIVIRMDLAESLLDREAVGLGLKEIKVKN